MIVPILTLIAVAAMMLAELWLSRSNEQWMFDHGAIAAPDPVYSTMKWAYPAAFLAMAAEGAIVGGPSEGAAIAGVILLVLAKAVKFWAIASLGKRWTYRVLVMPGSPLVASGPYRVIRHPNYVGVVGELIAMALLSGARVTGVLGVIGFGWLLIQRIGAEERALGLRTGA